MRILLCSVATIALSGCSWMGLGHGNHHGRNAAYMGKQNSYSQSNDDCCVGGKTLSRWNIEGGLGTSLPAGGDVLTGAQAHPQFNNVRTLKNLSYNDAFDKGIRAELGGSYALNPNRKVTGQIYQEKANGKDIVIGSQNGNALRGSISDYKEYGVEVGLRQYFQPKALPLLKTVRPYVEGKLGAAHVDDIRVDNIREIGGAATPISVNAYESSWVPTAAGLVGVETLVFDRFTMGIETGLRFRGVQKSDNSTIGTPGGAQYGGFNNGGSKYSVPITIRGRYRF
ncbi:MAG: hypothetical protein V3U57_02675 [Robiginitomaculum sp.]